MPAPTPLTSERLVRHGLFLMEDGQSIFLWVGRDAVPQLLMDVFGIDRMDQLNSGKVRFFLTLTAPSINLLSGHSSPTGQRIQSTNQCCHCENPRDEKRTLLASPLSC